VDGEEYYHIVVGSNESISALFKLLFERKDVFSLFDAPKGKTGCVAVDALTLCEEENFPPVKYKDSIIMRQIPVIPCNYENIIIDEILDTLKRKETWVKKYNKDKKEFRQNKYGVWLYETNSILLNSDLFSRLMVIVTITVSGSRWRTGFGEYKKFYFYNELKDLIEIFITIPEKEIGKEPPLKHIHELYRIVIHELMHAVDLGKLDFNEMKKYMLSNNYRNEKQSIQWKKYCNKKFELICMCNVILWEIQRELGISNLTNRALHLFLHRNSKVYRRFNKFFHPDTRKWVFGQIRECCVG